MSYPYHLTLPNPPVHFYVLKSFLTSANFMPKTFYEFSCRSKTFFSSFACVNRDLNISLNFCFLNFNNILSTVDLSYVWPLLVYFESVEANKVKNFNWFFPHKVPLHLYRGYWQNVLFPWKESLKRNLFSSRH